MKAVKFESQGSVIDAYATFPDSGPRLVIQVDDFTFSETNSAQMISFSFEEGNELISELLLLMARIKQEGFDR